MKPLRFVIFGAGFWARYQLAAWSELVDAQCVGICDPLLDKARDLARTANLDPSVAFNDAATMLEAVKPDFADIITDVGSHARLARLCFAWRIPVICQKPMASTLAEAEALVGVARKADVPFFIHENWRWQAPIRRLKELIDGGAIGDVFRGGIDMITGFPVFQNQPFLRELEQFILTDLGSHVLDTARFLFGEASHLTCVTGRVHPDIRGEDHATVLMQMGSRNIPVSVRMAYAENFMERECFPQTLFFVEGSGGSIEVAPDYQIKITTRTGTQTVHAPPPVFHWADPRYAVVQSSMVPCQANFLAALQDRESVETSAEDNLKTLRLVFGSYDSAASHATVHFIH